MNLILAIVLIAIVGNAHSYTSSGVGYDENCQLARSIAIKNALENFSMKTFEASQKKVCKEVKDEIDCLYQRELSTEIAGTFKRVIDEKASKDDSLCLVKVLIEVEKIRPLDVDVEGKSKFKDNDILELSITTNEPLYVYIYNNHDSGLQRLFPYNINKHEMITGTFRLQEHQKIVYKMSLAPQQTLSEETIIVVFSKIKLTFKNRLSKLEFYDTIRSVSPYSRRIMYHNFVIERSM